MTTENQPARMGGDLPDWAIAQAFREVTKPSEPGSWVEAIGVSAMLMRARELSAHGVDGGVYAVIAQLRREANDLIENNGCVELTETVHWRRKAADALEALAYLSGGKVEALATQQPASGEVEDMRDLFSDMYACIAERYPDSAHRYQQRLDKIKARNATPTPAAHGGSGEGSKTPIMDRDAATAQLLRNYDNASSPRKG